MLNFVRLNNYFKAKDSSENGGDPGSNPGGSIPEMDLNGLNRKISNRISPPDIDVEIEELERKKKLNGILFGGDKKTIQKNEIDRKDTRRFYLWAS